MRYAVAVRSVSAVAIRASLTLAYLNIDATLVNGNLSMFSYRYLGMYLTVAGVVSPGRPPFPRPLCPAAPRGPRSMHARPAVPVDARAWQLLEVVPDGPSRSIHAAARQPPPRTCW